MAQRFTTLDGLRAIAAGFVVVLHASPELLGHSLAPRAYLAVDFFFMLSGFVMAAAYDSKLAAGLTATELMRARVRRLWPTIAAGTLLGACIALVNGFDVGIVSLLTLLQLLFVPIIVGSNVPIYLLNGVQWSLLFELLANFCHALLGRRLRGRRLLLSVLLSGILLIALCWLAGNAAVGDIGRTFSIGWVRVAFPYLAGLGLYRLHRGDRLPKLGLSAASCAWMLSALLTVPGFLPRWWWMDAFLIVLCFPILIVAAVQARPGPFFARIAEVGGAYSYPLYAMHLGALAGAIALSDQLELSPGLLSFSLGMVAVCIVTLLTKCILGGGAVMRERSLRMISAGLAQSYASRST